MDKPYETHAERIAREERKAHEDQMVRQAHEAQMAREASNATKGPEHVPHPDDPRTPGDEATQANIAAAGDPETARDVRGAQRAARNAINDTTDVPPVPDRMPNETERDYAVRIQGIQEAARVARP